VVVTPSQLPPQFPPSLRQAGRPPRGAPLVAVQVPMVPGRLQAAQERLGTVRQDHLGHVKVAGAMARFQQRKEECGAGKRDEIKTFVDVIDVDEKRL
jgi:hypothetical protein